MSRITSQDNVDDVTRRLADALRSPALEAQWDDVLGGWDDAPDGGVPAVRGWVAGMRDGLLAMSEDIEDPVEVQLAVAIRYIELKSHWINLNTQIQYGLFRRGHVPGELMYRASVVSLLLGALEPFLDADDIEQITRFLAEPIRRGPATPEGEGSDEGGA